MSKPISVKRLKSNIENSRNRNEMIRILASTLPHNIKVNSDVKVIEGLQKRLQMVLQLQEKYCN